jgi:hypothetical protein
MTLCLFINMYDNARDISGVYNNILIPCQAINLILADDVSQRFLLGKHNAFCNDFHRYFINTVYICMWVIMIP